MHAHYLYDATGQRVKKLVRKQGGQVEVTHYIGGLFEHHRWGSQSQPGENNHLHVVDDQQRIAIVRVGPAHPDDRTPAVQFHLADHLGSSTVVVDDAGALVNREEFTPFGETSFGSFARKRYRFTGKERDEESGLAYHGARYLMVWSARWASCDPIGATGGLNLYFYAAANPMTFSDPAGTEPTDQQPDAEGNYWAPDETVEISGTAPPDLLGSAVAAGHSNPLPTRSQIAANITANINSFFPDWTPEGQALRVDQEIDPEAADATIQKRAGEIYDRIATDAVAKLQKQQTVMASALPFLGQALKFSAFTGLTAGFFGLAPGAGTPAGEAFLGSGTGVYMFAWGGLGFYNEMEEKATQPGVAIGATTGSGPQIVSPVYTQGIHDFLVVETSVGRQAFYRSSGINSDMPGTWLPFDENIADIRLGKEPYTEAGGFPRNHPLYRFGSVEFRQISAALGRRNIPMGGIPLQTAAQVNEILNLTGCRVNPQNLVRGVGFDNGPPDSLPGRPAGLRVPIRLRVR